MILQSILRRWFSLKLHKNKINCFIVRKNQIQQHNVQEGTYNTIKELYLFYSSSLIIICWCWSSHLLIFILTQKLFSSDKTSLFSRDTRTKLELLIKNKNATEKKASNVLLSLIGKNKTKHVSYYIILQDSFESSNKENMARPVFEKSVFVCGPLLKYYLNMEKSFKICRIWNYKS